MGFEIRKDPSTIYVLGTGKGWELTPNPTTATVYALNDYIKYEKYRIKPDRLFIMDVLDEKPQVVSGMDNLGDIIARINNFKVPLVAPYEYDEIPLSEAFPIDQCVKELGFPYFSNTIAYMIAYAILQKPKEIQIFGVNQASSHEYAEERGSVEYWIGQAVGRGIKVIVNGKESQVLKYKGRYGRNILYGYLQSYEEIKAANDKFGSPTIKKLIAPPVPFGRDIRTGRNIQV